MKTNIKKMSDTENMSHEENFPLSINKKDVGLFIGPKGKDLKKHVIYESKDRIRAKYDDVDEINGIFCMVQTNDDNEDVSVLIKVRDERFFEIVKDCLNQHQKRIQKKVDKKKDEVSKYVFKTKMEHMNIGKYIGRSGSNIQKVRDLIKEKEPSSKKIDIRICEDKKINLKKLRFHIINSDVDTNENVLVTVTMVTNDRNKTFDVLKEIINESFNDINHSDNDSDNEGGWGVKSDSNVDLSGW